MTLPLPVFFRRRFLMSLLVCVALAIAAGSGAAATSASAATRIIQPRIVNGSGVTNYDQDWPFLVALVSTAAPTNYGGLFCGGSLIAPTVVLTAAHCMYDGGQLIDLSSLAVIAGTSTLTNDTAGRIAVNDIEVHPGYDPLIFASDVALLYLASAPPLPAKVIPLIQPGQSALWGAGNGVPAAFIAGWGAMDDSGILPLPATANQAQIPLASDDACESDSNGGLSDAFYRGVMVCGSVLSADASPNGVDTCYGDSGGPLVVRDGNGAYLVGTTSWGYGCATNVYGAYSRVDTLRAWIEQEAFSSGPSPGTCTSAPGAISAPTATRLAAGRVRLTWTPAATGCVATSYSIVADGKAMPAWAGGSSMLLTSYADGQRVTIPITPTNNGVPGPTTNFSFTVLPDLTKPSRAQAARVESFRNKAVGKWRPATDGAGISKYGLALAGNHRVIRYTATSSRRTHVFARLRANTRYRFTIYAIDPYGNRSSVSAVAFRTRH